MVRPTPVDALDQLHEIDETAWLERTAEHLQARRFDQGRPVHPGGVPERYGQTGPSGGVQPVGGAAYSSAQVGIPAGISGRVLASDPPGATPGTPSIARKAALSSTMPPRSSPTLIPRPGTRRGTRPASTPKRSRSKALGTSRRRSKVRMPRSNGRLSARERGGSSANDSPTRFLILGSENVNAQERKNAGRMPARFADVAERIADGGRKRRPPDAMFVRGPSTERNVPASSGGGRLGRAADPSEVVLVDVDDLDPGYRWC